MTVPQGWADDLWKGGGRSLEMTVFLKTGTETLARTVDRGRGGFPGVQCRERRNTEQILLKEGRF